MLICQVWGETLKVYSSKISLSIHLGNQKENVCPCLNTAVNITEGDSVKQCTSIGGLFLAA